MICTVTIELHYSMAVWQCLAYCCLITTTMLIYRTTAAVIQCCKKTRRQPPRLLSSLTKKTDKSRFSSLLLFIYYHQQEATTHTHSLLRYCLGSTDWTVAHHPPTHCFTCKLLNPNLLPVNQARDRDGDRAGAVSLHALIVVIDSLTQSIGLL